MTARDDMAALLSSTLGANPLGAGLGNWYLDVIEYLATNPETAPVVFRWLVEAGVLCEGDGLCDCENVPWSVAVEAGPPWDGHYHVVLGVR